jgi:hypothetical protein
MKRSESYGNTRASLLRVPVMALGGAALLLGMAAGLARAGVEVPRLPEAAPLRHGPLMVSGFLGTLIAVERAVGLGRPWAWLGPLASAVGAALLLAGGSLEAAWAAFTVAAAVLVAVFAEVFRLRPEASAAVLLAGAAAWLGSALRGLAGVGTVELVPWWTAFLALTIAGERLELGRFRAPGARAVLLFAPAAGLVVVGALLTVADLRVGVRVQGFGLAALALWLARYDVAWRTIRSSGQARYIAACLLSGFGWLVAAGVLYALWPKEFAAGLRYDAMLHAFFLGFVMAMVFGHALIILPGVLGVRVPYRRGFYAQLLLLQAGLVVRVIGDLAGQASLRESGAVLNVAAVLLFLAATASSALAAARGPVFSRGSAAPRPSGSE